MNLRTIFKGLSKLFDWLWNINLILGISAVIFVTVNTFTQNKTITASYFGNFKVKTDQIGNLESNIGDTDIYINDFIGTPSVLINSKANVFLTYGYLAFILTIVLGFNFQLMKLFKELNSTIQEGYPFGNGISKRFLALSKLSMLFFITGLILTSAKLILINQIEFQNLILKPVFDSQVLNLAWLSVSFFIIASIFKVGFQLKTDNELTI